MRVLIVCASRHGATFGIAERIGETLRAAGIEATVRAPRDAKPEGYDAYVIGSAVYMFRWLNEASDFVHRHRALLSKAPVWVFSSGPIGTDLVDKDGNDVLAVPKPAQEAGDLIGARGNAVFFGAYDRDQPAIGIAEKLMRLAPAAKDAIPSGDFRDWTAIDAWAGEIAQALREPVAAG